ncbi:MAG: hypothetical protein ACLTC3_11880 [Evtepia gabavorous]
MEQKKRVIALGFFDGVHNGHAALMRRTAQVAREIGATPAAFTFDPHPQTVILGRPMPLLTSPEDRADLMRKYYGIQDVIVEPFTPQRMKQPWREFLEETLVGDLGAVHLVAGHDYHFGYKGRAIPSGSSRPARPWASAVTSSPRWSRRASPSPPPISAPWWPRAKLSGPTSFWATPTPSATGCPTGRSWAPPWAFPP